MRRVYQRDVHLSTTVKGKQEEKLRATAKSNLETREQKFPAGLVLHKTVELNPKSYIAKYMEKEGRAVKDSKVAFFASPLTRNCLVDNSWEQELSD